MIRCTTGERSAEVCLDIHQWLGSPSVNIFPVQFLVLCLSDLYAFRVCLALPCVCFWTLSAANLWKSAARAGSEVLGQHTNQQKKVIRCQGQAP